MFVEKLNFVALLVLPTSLLQQCIVKENGSRFFVFDHHVLFLKCSSSEKLDTNSVSTSNKQQHLHVTTYRMASLSKQKTTYNLHQNRLCDVVPT